VNFTFSGRPPHRTLAHALGLQAVVAWEGAQGSPRAARGQVFGAEEALAKGLLTRVLPDAEVYLKIAWLAQNSQVGPAGSLTGNPC
jgi:enoyl-CoA hydratase/carnithine racemase